MDSSLVFILCINVKIFRKVGRSFHININSTPLHDDRECSPEPITASPLSALETNENDYSYHITTVSDVTLNYHRTNDSVANSLSLPPNTNATVNGMHKIRSESTSISTAAASPKGYSRRNHSPFTTTFVNHSNQSSDADLQILHHSDSLNSQKHLIHKAQKKLHSYQPKMHPTLANRTSESASITPLPILSHTSTLSQSSPNSPLKQHHTKMPSSVSSMELSQLTITPSPNKLSAHKSGNSLTLTPITTEITPHHSTTTTKLKMDTIVEESKSQHAPSLFTVNDSKSVFLPSL